MSRSRGSMRHTSRRNAASPAPRRKGKRMAVRFAVLAAVLLTAGAWWVYRSDDAIAIPELTANAQAGARLFASNCALCHGANATGTDRGPPLVHKVYEPGHHPDGAFYRAVNQGVVSHHWSFGNMPPVPGVSQRSVTKIVAYVRELQRANGIR